MQVGGARAPVDGQKEQAVRLEVLTVNLRVQVIRPEVGLIGLRGRVIGLGVPAAGPGGLEDGPRVKAADVGKINRIHLYFFVTVAVKKSYISSVINNGDYFSFSILSSLVFDALEQILWHEPSRLYVA